MFLGEIQKVTERVNSAGLIRMEQGSKGVLIWRWKAVLRLAIYDEDLVEPAQEVLSFCELTQKGEYQCACPSCVEMLNKSSNYKNVVSTNQQLRIHKFNTFCLIDCSITT